MGLVAFFWGENSEAKVSQKCLDELAFRLDTRGLDPGWSLNESDMTGRGLDPGYSVAITDPHVSFKGSIYKQLDVEWDEELDTARYFSTNGLVVEGSRFITPFYHGNGAVTSHSGTGLVAVHMGSNLLHSDKVKGLTGKIKGQVDELVLGSWYALDLPGHGIGPDRDKYRKLSSLSDWVTRDLKMAKQSNLPVIPIGRSGSTGVLAQINLQHPGLMSGMILMSGVHPAEVEHAREWVVEASKEGSFRPVWPNLDWIFEHYRQMDWHTQKDPFGNTPTLILLGADDPQVSEAERVLFKQMVKEAQARGKDVQIVEVPDARHDVLAEPEGWRHILEFQARITEAHEKANTPFRKYLRRVGNAVRLRSNLPNP